MSFYYGILKIYGRILGIFIVGFILIQIWLIGKPNDSVTSNQALEPKDLALLDSERALSMCVRDICVFAYCVLILG